MNKFHSMLLLASSISLTIMSGCGNTGAQSAPSVTVSPDLISPSQAPVQSSIPVPSDAAPVESSSPVEKASAEPTGKHSPSQVDPVLKDSPAPSAKPTAKPSVKPSAKPVEKPATAPPASPANEPSAAPAEQTVATIAEPETIAVMVNKQNALPVSYIPPDLTEPKVNFSFSEKVDKRLMRKDAAVALEKLFAGAKKDGVILYAVSGYRSYQTQKSLYNAYVKRDGEQAASRYSAQPGKSEHQTGLAMDVSSESAGFRLVESFGTTAEGKWLASHAAEYGFIIRYQEGKEHITGYLYEPWHIRYIGVELAQEVYKQGVTLEEYFHNSVPVIK